MADGGRDREPPAREKELADVCCVCDKRLPRGAERSLLDVYAICVECRDAGHGGPARPDRPPVG